MIILIGGQKGGCGKTNTATNLAACLVGKGKDLILIDTDQTQNSSAKWAARRRIRDGVKPVNCVLAHDDIRGTVADLNKRYEIILIDAGGRDSIEFRTALTVADICVTPFAPSQHDIDTLPLVSDVIAQSKVFNPNLKAFALLSNCPQNKQAREKRLQHIAEMVEELGEFTLLETQIINRISYTDTASNGLGVVEMQDDKAKAEIENLCSEIL